MHTIGASVEEVARFWHDDPYYERAERDDWMAAFWDPGCETFPFRRLFERLDLSVTVELAVGHGRHAAQIVDRAPALIVMDVVAENVEYCKARFAGRQNVACLRNGGADFRPLPDGAVSAIYCYDAMVHFEYDVVLSYIRDAARVLRRGGRALFHHSNYDKDPGGNHRTHPGGRNFMSQALFVHAARRVGFGVLESIVMDWHEPGIDCLTLLEKH